MALVPFPQQRNDSEDLPARPDGFSPFDDEEPVGEGRMSFLEHLDELRKRITHAVVGLCGNEVITTRGRGHACSHAARRLAKKSWSGPMRT